MRPIAYPAIFALILLSACVGQLKKKEKAGEDSLGAVLKETIATGDTGFYRIAGFKKDNISDNLCQHWERNKYDGATSSVYVRDENEKPINAQYNFFKDGSVLENGRHRAHVGTWQMTRDTLVLSLNGNVERKYHIAELNSKDLRLTTKSEDGKTLHLNLAGNQLVHKNMLNDPFHPSNNQWRIQPSEPESDSTIKQRVVSCIKFYALFYRDHIYRNRSVINFEGLPKIFRWYNGGLGLPKESEVDSSWINCFYNEKQAMRGYELIDRLITDYEFNWPKNGENIEWWHQTHSVLEQMYHRALDM